MLNVFSMCLLMSIKIPTMCSNVLFSNLPKIINVCVLLVLTLRVFTDFVVQILIIYLTYRKFILKRNYINWSRTIDQHNDSFKLQIALLAIISVRFTKTFLVIRKKATN